VGSERTEEISGGAIKPELILQSDKTMATKCSICNRVKGKRICKIQDRHLICSQCCGENRGSRCEGCPYFEDATRLEKLRNASKREKEFIIEIKEEIDEAVDRALEAVERKKFSQAKKILDGLLQTDPKYYMVLYGQGVFFAMQKQYDAAIEYFKKTVNAFPVFVEAQYNLAVAYQSIFDIANMIRAFRKVINLTQPGSEFHAKALDMIQYVEKSMRENNGPGLDAFIKAQDEFDQAFHLMENGDWKNAIKGFERSLRWHSGLPQPYGNMGICYAKMGERQAAIAAFERALEIDPNYEPAISNKAATEKLEEGQSLSQPIKVTRYYGSNRQS
jgi:tetratricopeptide (TPR) repeat protein